jgi:Ca2+-binding EF-hand superfamily protein
MKRPPAPQPLPGAPRRAPLALGVLASLGAAAALVPTLPAAQEVYYPSEKIREQAYFEICDHDRNGWISYREAAHSLRLTRIEYPVFDTDRDGRISRGEFSERYRKVVDQTGAFQEPLLGDGPTRAITRNPEQLLRAFDQDADRALNEREVQNLLGAYNRGSLSVEVLFGKLDRDGDGGLQGVELSALARVLTAPLEEEEVQQEQGPKSVDELFGQVIPRPAQADSAAQPPRIPGPVPHFRRLDLDNDGRITMDDLRRLQSPLQLKARAGAAWATFDLNGDEGVDLEEVLASM